MTKKIKFGLLVLSTVALTAYATAGVAQDAASMSAADKGDVANSATHADKKASKARKKSVKAEKKAEQKDAN